MHLPAKVNSLSLCKPSWQFKHFLIGSPPGGPGSDPPWGGEGPDVQSVSAVGVSGEPADALGCPVRTPERGP